MNSPHQRDRWEEFVRHPCWKLFREKLAEMEIKAVRDLPNTLINGTHDDALVQAGRIEGYQQINAWAENHEKAAKDGASTARH